MRKATPAPPNPRIIMAQVAGSGIAPTAVGPTRRLLTSQSPALAVTPAGSTNASIPNGTSKLLLNSALAEVGSPLPETPAPEPSLMVNMIGVLVGIENVLVCSK